MKPNYILFLILTIVAFSCKKEVSQIQDNQSAISVNAGTCFGNTWTATGDFTVGLTYFRLVYNNKLYVFRSQNGPDIPEGVHVYDGSSWQTMPVDIPITTYGASVFGFTIGNKGYIGTSQGLSGAFYEYDFAANTFTPKAIFPAPQNHYGTATFAVGNKGYVMGGYYTQNGSFYNSSRTYEYDPASNTWNQKADFAWLGMSYCTGFSIANKGYLINGRFTLLSGDVYPAFFREYDPATDTWTSKAAFPGNPRISTNLFIISGNAYAGGGSGKISGSNVEYKDFYKYNPALDTWSQIPDFPISTQLHFTAFTLNSRGYVTYHNQFTTDKIVKYTPLICSPLSAGSSIVSTN